MTTGTKKNQNQGTRQELSSTNGTLNSQGMHQQVYTTHFLVCRCPHLQSLVHRRWGIHTLTIPKEKTHVIDNETKGSTNPRVVGSSVLSAFVFRCNWTRHPTHLQYAMVTMLAHVAICRIVPQQKCRQ